MPRYSSGICDPVLPSRHSFGHARIPNQSPRHALNHNETNHHNATILAPGLVRKLGLKFLYTVDDMLPMSSTGRARLVEDFAITLFLLVFLGDRGSTVTVTVTRWC
jgi:hypothetical protein